MLIRTLRSVRNCRSSFHLEIQKTAELLSFTYIKILYYLNDIPYTNIGRLTRRSNCKIIYLFFPNIIWKFILNPRNHWFQFLLSYKLKSVKSNSGLKGNYSNHVSLILLLFSWELIIRPYPQILLQKSYFCFILLLC